MTAISPAYPAGVTRSRGIVAVRVWLAFVAALVALMVIVGGATRLTDSGLSITEWQPILGAVPPMNEADWGEAFEKYRATPEYQRVNRGMSLDEFKRIYWWEWAHRFLGRVIGLAFLAPFLVLLAVGAIPRRQVPRLAGLFVLGGLQGAIGWWMVRSGLVDRVDVSQYRLAVHLTLACVIFAAILWTIFEATPPRHPVAASPGLRLGAGALLALVLAQIFLGGLVAGLDAGLAYNTWPLMDEQVVPDGLFAASPWWVNPFENVLTVQFNHRVLAYLVALVAVIHAVALWTLGARARALALSAAVGLQVALGIATLLHAVPLGLALAHQAGALLLLALAVWNAERAFARPAR